MVSWLLRILLFLWITYFYHLYRWFSFAFKSLTGLGADRQSLIMYPRMDVDLILIPLPYGEYGNVVDQMDVTLRDYHALHATDEQNPDEYKVCSICDLQQSYNDYIYYETHPEPPSLLADDFDITDSVMQSSMGFNIFDFVNPNELIGMNIASNALVDPSSLLPYTPFNDHCYYQPKTEVMKSEHGLDSVGVTPNPSESSGDEIDVVTVAECKEEFQLRNASRGRRGSKVNGKGSQKIPSVSARTATLKKRKTAKVPKQAKNVGHAIRAKCMKRNAPESPPNSSRSSSDSEDLEKRTQHNDLERMRREAQKFALFVLRDNIPHVKASGKTAKVCIISEAATYIRLLTAQAKVMEQKKKLQKQRHDVLRRKLDRLKRSMGIVN